MRPICDFWARQATNGIIERIFFGAAAEAMRRILVDHARSRQRKKRGGEYDRIDLKNLDELGIGRPRELLALDDALSALAEEDTRKAELVKLKFFGGLSTHDAGELLGISNRTAERDWAFSRVWLYREMGSDQE